LLRRIKILSKRFVLNFNVAPLRPCPRGSLQLTRVVLFILRKNCSIIYIEKPLLNQPNLVDFTLDNTMVIFESVLHGNYGALLITQVLVVSGLMLALLWIVVRRTRESYADMPTIAVDVAADLELAKVQKKELEELQLKIVALEESKVSTDALGDENRVLNEKLRYLESKLLEYEILQEEIGTLSMLKEENEHLRRQINAAGLSEPPVFEPPAKTSSFEGAGAAVTPKAESNSEEPPTQSKAKDVGEVKKEEDAVLSALEGTMREEGLLEKETPDSVPKESASPSENVPEVVALAKKAEDSESVHELSKLMEDIENLTVQSSDEKEKEKESA